MNKLELTRQELTTILQAATGNVKDFVMDNDKFIDEQLKAINYTHCCDKLPQDPIVLARYMHDNYEALAKNNDWNTQENCKVDFSDLPIGNKNTMILLAGKLILDFGGN